MIPRTIVLEHVSKAFGNQLAVSDVDLALAAGECIGLVGHNGAGKTTLIKLMLGLLRPDSGHISVLGADPAGRQASQTRRVIGYIPENVALYPSLTGEETLAFYARLKGIAPVVARPLLARVGLSMEAIRRSVRTYSKGMRQRLALAQAMLGAPRVLLLDEPTSGLDPALRQSFYEVLHDLRDRGATVLLSSHQLAELEDEVDRVVVMSQGRMMADGDLQYLRRLTGITPRVRIRLASTNASPPGGWQAVTGGMWEMPSAEEEIADRLRALPVDVTMVEILRPTLDDIYAAFLRRPGDVV
ncbi:MAG: ABC transporter ATP-binding protein [Rhizomicrobium sp.]